MYENWAHYYIPKVDGALSFLINPLFIYIVVNEKKLSLGNYKYLLLYFAIFNMTCSMCDILVPVNVYDYRYAFASYISGGPFVEYSEMNQLILAMRCGFISGTYAILHAHFVYRYLVVSNNKFLQQYFIPYGILASILYLLFHISFWMVACGIYLKSDDERRLYIKDAMNEDGLDPFQLNMLTALYQDGSEEVVTKSLIGIISITILSVLSVIVYVILGYMIIEKLNDQALLMSEKTKRLQRYLMKALIVQATIPILVSFGPCAVTWFNPFFGVSLGSWTYHMATIAISAFPFMDPLVILLFLPLFRKRLIEIFSFAIRKKKNENCTVQTTNESKV